PSAGCDILPCATLDQSPLISGVQGLITHFNWQTDCDHLLDINGVQQQERIFNFILKAQDDYCTVPGQTFKTIQIRLKNSENLPPVDMHCVNVLPNGDVDLTWEKTTSGIGTFAGYEIRSIEDGLITTILDINEENYTHVGANCDLSPKK